MTGIKTKVGITGNSYAYSKKRTEMEKFCVEIGKAISGIYYSPRMGGVWAIRVKDKRKKELIKNYKNENQ